MKGLTRNSRVERERERERAIIDTKPDAHLGHVLPHCVESAETFQMSPSKEAFGGRTAFHAPPEQCKGHPHDDACY
jgi:hypothetical protein